MIMLAKMQMPSMVNTMSIHQQEELNVVKGNACNCFCSMWKLASYTMVTKVSQITSWVPVRSLPWAQHKRWIPIGSMECMHAHQKILAIEGLGSLSHIWNDVQKTKENYQKVGKIGRTINQTPALGLKHDRIWAWWASDILLKSMFIKVWWCKCFGYGIFKLNHLLLDELFKWKKTCTS